MKEKLKKFWNEEKKTILVSTIVMTSAFAGILAKQAWIGKDVHSVNDFLNDDGNQVVLIRFKNGNSQAFTKRSV